MSNYMDYSTSVATNESTEVTEPVVAEKPKPKPRRKPVRSLAEQLAEMQTKADDLRRRIEQQITTERLALVADLYAHHGIDVVEGDLDETQRLAALRAELGLD